MSESVEQLIGAALRRRLDTGQHLHHRDCIHNLTPREQIEMRGKTVEWWTRMIGSMPVQITSDDWEAPPLFEYQPVGSLLTDKD